MTVFEWLVLGLLALIFVSLRELIGLARSSGRTATDLLLEIRNALTRR